MSSIRRLPQATGYQDLRSFIADFLRELKTTLNTENFLTALKQLDIRSRATFFSLIRRRREISAGQLGRLLNAFDFSRREQEHLNQLKQLGTAVAATAPLTEKILVRPDILSHPLYTVILNVCSLEKHQTRNQMEAGLAGFATEDEIRRMTDLLIEEKLIAETDEGFLRRIEFRVLSTLPGVKSDHSRNYIAQSLQLAEKSYALDLAEREYVSFTSRIAAEDMGKLKDLVRQFREDIYALRERSGCDTVVQINLNAFTVYKDNLQFKPNCSSVMTP